MFWIHFKAIFYRNLLIHSDSIPFFMLIMILLNLVKFYFGVSYEIYFFLSMLIIIYIFQRNLILNFIEDKILKFRNLFKVAGMTDFNYILAQVVSNFILMFFLICFGYFFILIQRNFDVSLLELQFLFVSCLFAFSLITFNLFMSLFFKNPLLAADISNMITFVLNLLAMILTLIESPFISLIRIIPNTPYYVMVKAIVIDTKTTTIWTLVPDMCLLVFLMIFYLYIYYKLDKIMGDDNGMNRGLMDVLKDAFKSKSEEQIEEDLDDSENELEEGSSDSNKLKNSLSLSRTKQGQDRGFYSKQKTHDFGVKENLSVISEEPTEHQKFSYSRPILKLKQICKQFEGNEIFRIKKLDMEFRRGEICCLIGANGAGKSTLLNLISGIYRTDKGFIKYYDKKGRVMKERQNIGFCSSENILFHTLTVDQHFKFFFMLQGIENYEIEADRLMKIFNIKKYRSFRASELSGGNKRKLSVAISFIGEPDIILLDEPSSSLDPFSKKEMFKILTNMNLNKKCTIILTSHDFQEIQTFHKDICLMKVGKVVSRGNLKKIKRYFGVGTSIKISKSSFMDKPDIVNKIKHRLEVVEKSMKKESIQRLSFTQNNISENLSGHEASFEKENLDFEGNEQVIKQLSEMDFPPNSVRESIEIRYDARGDLFIEVPNLISDHLNPIYEAINELLGNDIQVDVTNALDIQKVLYREGEIQAANEFSFEPDRLSHQTRPRNMSENNFSDHVKNSPGQNKMNAKPRSETKSVMDSFDLSGELDNNSRFSESGSEYGLESLTGSTYAFSKVNEYMSEQSQKFYKPRDLKQLREKILKGMERKNSSGLSTRIVIIIKMRFKFLIANAVELTTVIIVTGITTLCGSYCFVVAETIFPMVTLNELIYYSGLMILVTEGYNNILYSYHMVYENSFSIKKLLICNGLKIHEYYFAHMIADFLINLFIQIPIFLALSVTMRLMILESVLSNYQIFLFCLVLLMWKMSFIVANYFYSFIFIRTNFVTRNFCVLYLVVSGLCLVCSKYVPILFYFNDFVFCLNMFETFDLIENRLMEIILVPIFQICFFFILIQIYEHHSITHNYLANFRKTKKDNSSENINLVNNSKDKHKSRSRSLKVRIRNLKKIYTGTKPSLNLSSLKLNKKDCIGLIGPNGAGKSTFFNVLISEIKKSGGLIMFGKTPNEIPFYKYTFAVCLQKNSLWIELTVKDHFDFYCKLIGIRDKVFIRSIIEYFELELFINHSIYQLTDGNMRKVCIALSLLRKPDFILFDEATTGIDIINCHNIQILIKDIQKRFGSIMIVTSHLMREVEFLCDSIGVLYDGEFALYDSIEATKNVFSRRVVKIIVNNEGFDEEEFTKILKPICDIEKKGESTESRRMYEIVSLNGKKNVLDLLKKIDELRLLGMIKDYDISKKTLDDIFIDLIRKTKTHREREEIHNSENYHLDAQIILEDSTNLRVGLKAKHVHQQLKHIRYMPTLASMPASVYDENQNKSFKVSIADSKDEDMSKTLIDEVDIETGMNLDN